jgi:hypothetical protein
MTYLDFKWQQISSAMQCNVAWELGINLSGEPAAYIFKAERRQLADIKI